MQSKRKTTVAVLRQLLGISLEDFARLIGKSLSTVGSLETTGRLKLSEETALRISQETGVEMAWLLAGNPKEKPYTLDDSDQKRPYSKELFELIQAQRKTGRIYPSKPALHLVRAISISTDWLSVFSAAADNGKAELASYLIREFLAGLVERLGKDDAKFLELNRDARIIAANGSQWTFQPGAEGIRLEQVKVPKPVGTQTVKS